MFREMRRKAQQLTEAQAEEILLRGTSGVLALSGDDGYPYALPISYAYRSGKIYFHAATVGHKLDAISRCDKVSFCVIAKDEVLPERFTTRYASVIAFGRARVLCDKEQKARALSLFARRFAPGDEEGVARETEKGADKLVMIELDVEHLTGKRSGKED